jgi:hypothetical protein
MFNAFIQLAEGVIYEFRWDRKQSLLMARYKKIQDGLKKVDFH